MNAKKGNQINIKVPPKLMRNFQIVVAMKQFSQTDLILKFLQHVVDIHLKQVDLKDVLEETDENTAKEKSTETK